MNNKTKIDIEMTLINECVNNLTTYAPNFLFGGDNPSTKEKKEESRCHDVMSNFYSSSNHQPIYEALSAMKNSVLLGCNDIVIRHFYAECGTLERLFNAHLKTVNKFVKSEPRLKQYYSVLPNLNLFEVANTFGLMFVDETQLNEYKPYFKQDYKDLV